MKTVEHVWCSSCGKRGFAIERLADRALGRARAKRNRMGDARGTRRGLTRESRFYECPEGLFHLTHESHKPRRLVDAA